MYKHCPKCSGTLVPNKVNLPNFYVCQKCSYEFYQNSKPTASTIIFNSFNQILLVKRAIKPSLHLWDIPGGFLKNGEEPIAGLKREIKEELGINMRLGQLIGIYIDKYHDKSGEIYFTFNLYYKSKILKGKVILNKENSEFKWFSRKNIPWKHLAFQQTKRAIKDYFEL